MKSLLKQSIDFVDKRFYQLILLMLTGLLAWLIVGSDDTATVLFARLGFLFAVFQFCFLQLNNRERKYFDLRYTFYKETIKQLNLIGEIIQEGMIKEVKAEETMHKLMAAVNEIRLSIQANEALLFPKLRLNPSSIAMGNCLEGLVKRTDAYHVAVSNDDSKEALFFESMNWHNEVREILQRFNEEKHAFLDTIRTYL